MKFFGKEIPVDKVNFVTNIVSFVLGVIFFVRMQYKLNEKAPVPVLFNAEHDSLVAIQTRVNTQLSEIKKVQDSIIQTINRNEIKLTGQKPHVIRKRRSVYVTMDTDWNDLSRESQDQYINKLLSHH